MNKAFALYQHQRFVYFFAIIGSILLSSWIGYREAIINTDGICYLLSAQVIGESGIRGAMHLCGQANWPFYSALIYGFVQLSHLSYPLTAYLLDGVFSLSSVLLFVLIVKEMGGSQRVLWLAALTILLSHEFNSVREYIVRDHGFWAFYLASMLCLLHYFRKPQWQTALGWSASLFIATLFRIEGFAFLCLLPFLSFLCVRYPLSQRIKFFFTLNLPLLLIGFALTAWLLLHPQQTLDQLGRVAEIVERFQHTAASISGHFQNVKIALLQYILPSYAAKDVTLVMFLAAMAWYIVSVINNLSWGYFSLTVYGWWRKADRTTSLALLVLCGYIFVNVIVTLTFFLQYLFLSKRYLIALSLVLMLWVPFALDSLIQQWATVRYRLFLLLTMLLICISSLGGIFDFGYSKAYIHQAGNWLAENVPSTASLYVNDRSLMYYSHHFGYALFAKAQDYNNIDAISHGKWKKYDYIALRLSKKEEDKMASVLQEIRLSPIQAFNNKRGDRIVIYKIKSKNS